MGQAAQHVPLTRRLVGQYLAFGLAGLLLCIGSALTLAFRDSLVSFISLVAVGPAIVLGAGAVVLYQTTRLNSMIEQELKRASEQSADRPKPLLGADPVVQGWNAILERLGNEEVESSLDERLAAAVGNIQQQRTEQVLQQLPLPIAVTEGDCQITLSNQAFEAVARGLGAASLEGQNLLEILRLNEATNAPELFAKLQHQKGNLSFEVRRGNSLHDGVLHVVRKTVSDESNDSTQQIWVIRDVTQQLLAEEMRNQFVLTATHELRTPLANIKAYAETLALEDGIDVESQKEFCNIINAEATRLSRFIDELLNISQMEAGSLTLQRHETDLLRLLGEVVENVRPEIDSKSIELEVRLPPKLAKQRIDKDKFAAALVNLLGNAAKYTPENGRILFEVTLEQESVCIQVEDSGIGIAEDELPRVFEKFFRSQDERLAEISGNGLGLAYTQEVVRLHGGRIDVQSELNKGTRFAVTLPI